MAIYVYKSASGKVIEKMIPITRAPKIGHKIKHAGEVYVRVPNIPEPKVSPNIHFTSHSLPRATKQADSSWHSPYSKHVEPETGKPRFHGMTEVRDAESRSKDIDGDKNIVYD